MKASLVLPFFAGLAMAAPATIDTRDASVEIMAAAESFAHAEIEATREAKASSIYRDELINGNSGSCPQVIFIFARGSMELDNMGSLVGPALADGIEAALGAQNVWVQGVGRDYAANLEGNLYPDGTQPKSIAEMLRLLRDADAKCPNAKIIAGGYSQGAALAAAAIRDVESRIRNKIVGTALYGYTKNQQNGGRIVNYPADRTVVFCNSGDRVCEGTLIVAPPHLDYSDAAGNAGPNFLIGKVRA